MAKLTTSKIIFNLQIDQISQLEWVESPGGTVQGQPWNVCVRKDLRNGKHSLEIHLRSAKRPAPYNWRYVAWAKIKLLSFSDEKNIVEKRFAPCVFKANGNEGGFSSTILWSDLFDSEKGYVKDDVINIEIEIEAENQNKINKSKLEIERIDRIKENTCAAVVHLVVSNINNLMAVMSTDFVLQNVIWDLTVLKNSSNLQLRLQHEKSEDSLKVTMAAKLVSSKENVPSIEKVCETNIENNEVVDLCEIISWGELLKPENGFVENDSIKLEVKIEVENCKPKEEEKIIKMECAICLESLFKWETSVTPCGHLFCSTCISNELKYRPRCPTCKSPITLYAIHRVYSQ